MALSIEEMELEAVELIPAREVMCGGCGGGGGYSHDFNGQGNGDGDGAFGIGNGSLDGNLSGNTVVIAVL
jgi:hypothetical protein